MTDKYTQSTFCSDSADPNTIISSFADSTTSPTTALNAKDVKTESHSALFGLTPQTAPTKHAGSGPGTSITGTTGVKGTQNSALSTDVGRVTSGKPKEEAEKA